MIYTKSKKTFSLLILLLCLFPAISFSSMKSAIKEGQKTFFGATNGDYKDLASVAKTLMEEEVYFAAIPFLKEALYIKADTTIDKNFDDALEKIILEVGKDQFSSMDLEVLKKSNAPAINLVIADKLVKKNSIDEALTYLNKVSDGSFAYAPAMMLKAYLLSKQSKYDEAVDTYKLCLEDAEKQRSKFDDIEHLERSYQFIKDSCNISVARTLYKAERFKESSDYYRSIPKTSYKWPSILLEDSWNSYRLKDYSRSIGRLLTFRSPILKDYFFPEAEVLKAMGYLELCLWDDALEVIKYYQQVYSPGGQKLIELLKSPKDEKQYYVRMSLKTNKKEAVNNFPFLENSMENIQSRPYFISSMYHLKKFAKEYKVFKIVIDANKKDKSLQKSNSYKFAKILLYNLKESKKDQISLVNQYVKKSLYDIANEVNRTSTNLLAINLEIFSRKKDQIFENKDIMTKERGNLKDIDRMVTQYFWTFKKEFWADELGDYVLALESECTDKDKKKNDDASISTSDILGK